MTYTERRVLIVGDSIALGVDAGEPLGGIGGRLSSEFPHTDVVVRADHDSTLQDLPRRFPRDSRLFDALLIVSGRLDVLRFTPVRELAAAVRNVVTAARERSPLVIVANSVCTGGAALLQWPLTALQMRQATRVANVFRSVCTDLDVAFVNMALPRTVSSSLSRRSADACSFLYRTIVSRTPLRAALALVPSSGVT